MTTHDAPLTEHEIKLASAHFNRVASPELQKRMNTKDPKTGLRLGDDEEVIRAWLKRARSTDEGFATLLYGVDAAPFDDEKHEISRRLGDEEMRERSEPNSRQHFKPGDTSKAAILASFYPASRR